MESMEELLCYHKLSKEAGWHEEGESTVTKMKALIRRFIGLLTEQDEKHNVTKWSKSAVTTSSLEWSNLSPLDWTMIWRSILLLSYDKNFCQVFGKEKILMECLAHSASAAWVDLLKSFVSLDPTCPECRQSTTAVSGGKCCSTCSIIFMKVLPVESACCLSPSCQHRNNYACISGQSCGYCQISYRQLLDDWKGLEKPFYYNGISVSANSDFFYKSVVHVDLPESLSNPKHFGHLAWKFCEFMASLEDTSAAGAAAEVCLLMASLEGTAAGGATPDEKEEEMDLEGGNYDKMFGSEEDGGDY